MGVTANPVLISFHNILFTTDFSPSSESALPLAGELARRFAAKMVLAHVVAAEPRLPMPIEPLPPQCDVDRQAAKVGMARLRSLEAVSGVDYDCVLMRGDLWPNLEALIRERKIDLVVAATHAREGLSKLLMGSVAEQIFRNARCPVLTVGPRASHFLQSGHFQRVLFATDFSPAADAAFPYALALARQDDAELLMVHIVPPDAALPPDMDIALYEDRLLSNAETRLRDIIGESTAVRSDFAVQYGFPTEQIAAVAEQSGAGVIVMGVRRHGAASIHLPWRTAHRVVCHAPCPVLTVRI